MANTTVSVLLIASLCLLVSSIPVNPGIRTAYINMSAGRTKGMMFQTLRQAEQQILSTATIAQKPCIIKTAHLAMDYVPGTIDQIALQLNKRVVEPSEDFESIKSVINEAFKKALDDTSAKIKEFDNC